MNIFIFTYLETTQLTTYPSTTLGGTIHLPNPKHTSSLGDLFFPEQDDFILTRLHKSRSSRSELEFDLSNFV